MTEQATVGVYCKDRCGNGQALRENLTPYDALLLIMHAQCAKCGAALTIEAT